MRAWILALVLAGCSFQAKPGGAAGPPGDDAPSDAAVEIPPDSPPLDGKLPPLCAGTFEKVCTDPPSQITTITQAIDTDNSPACAPYTADPAVSACVIVGTSINVPGTGKIAVTGKRKLILLAAEAITVDATLDAASHNNANGPGTSQDACKPTSGATKLGGGAGGSFGTAGNNGGDSPGGGKGANAADTVDTPNSLRAGCDGSNGSGSDNRGRGGGGVLLVAKQTITINGTINASGGGGRGVQLTGGGGGGSGGMIVLEAPDSVTINGKCFANGAGGGGGGWGIGGGGDGKDPGAPDQAAGGGGGTANVGGNGGTGSIGNDDPTTGQAGNSGNTPLGRVDAGGGGGGGGGGIIKIITNTPPTTAGDKTKISPAPIVSAP